MSDQITTCSIESCKNNALLWTSPPICHDHAHDSARSEQVLYFTKLYNKILSFDKNITLNEYTFFFLTATSKGVILNMEFAAIKSIVESIFSEVNNNKSYIRYDSIICDYYDLLRFECHGGMQQ